MLDMENYFRVSSLISMKLFIPFLCKKCVLRYNLHCNHICEIDIFLFIILIECKTIKYSIWKRIEI